MNTFNVKILASDGAEYQGPCVSLIVPTSDGQYGIMALHSNMISAIVPGKLTYRTPEGVEHILAVSSGLVKAEGGEVLVLVGAAERPEEIDANRARRELEASREAVLQRRSIHEYRLAQANIARALNRLRVKGETIVKAKKAQTEKAKTGLV